MDTRFLLVLLLAFLVLADALPAVGASEADSGVAVPRSAAEPGVTGASEDEQTQFQIRRRLRERRHGRPYGTGFEARREAAERIERPDGRERNERPERVERGGLHR